MGKLFYLFPGGPMENNMTSVERVDRVLKGGIPDRVPTSLHNFMMSAYASGMSFPEYLQSGEAMAEGGIKAWREYGQDLVILENGTVALAQACGCEVEYLAGSAPALKKPVLGSLDEIDRLVIPDVYTAHPLKENLKATRLVVQEIGQQAFIMGRADQGPYSLASMLLGIEDFLMAVVDPENRNKLHRLLEFTTEVVYRYAVAQAEAGAHITSIGESLSGPDVSSPKVYREYEWPYAKKLVERLNAKGIRLAYHICGNATRIAGDMVSTGAALLELDYKCDLAMIKEAVRGKTSVLGVIDPSGVLALGTPEEVGARAREELAIMAPGGGFVLSPGCGLPPKTPPANIHALIETAARYGHYKPDGSLVH
jgi:uroporphyrinogen decarboxylase